MGIYTRSDLGSEWAVIIGLKDIRHCFLCGGPVTPPAVFWHGNDEDSQAIVFHFGCAGRMSKHLKEDDDKYLRAMQNGKKHSRDAEKPLVR